MSSGFRIMRLGMESVDLQGDVLRDEAVGYLQGHRTLASAPNDPHEGVSVLQQPRTRVDAALS